VYLLAGDGPTTPRIRESVERLGLGERVRLLGRVSEETLERLYRGADLFLMPNVPVAGDIEGFGVVMLEAGLCGLPTVAAELEGIRDVVREGENGHLLPSGDAEGFLAAIERYRADPARLAAASDRAARFVRDTFSWERVADRYVREIGRELSAEGRAEGPYRSVRSTP
jgi:phosphatidyl-myo-inositol dimannoside synthase